MKPHICKSDGPRSKGFTLVELIVAIGIVCILASLVFTTTQSIRASGASGKCISNQRQIISATLMYAADHNGQLPPFNSFTQSGRGWFNLIGPYIGEDFWNPPNKSSLMCPAEFNPKVIGTYGPSYGRLTPGWGEGGVFSYEGSPYQGESAWTGSLRLTQISPKAMIFADAAAGVVGEVSPAAWPPEIMCPGIWPMAFDATYKTYNGLSFRHNGLAYAAFIDGSVKAITLEDWKNNESNLWNMQNYLPPES